MFKYASSNGVPRTPDDANPRVVDYYRCGAIPTREHGLFAFSRSDGTLTRQTIQDKIAQFIDPDNATNGR